jgi:hypothetical protein
MSMDPGLLIKAWWNLYQADPRSNFDDIISGMRQELVTTGTITYKGGVTRKIVPSQQQTGSCQYWVKGLPAICSNWNSGNNRCSVGDSEKPSGYGYGLCDMLGRREWCSHYEKGDDDDLEKFVCVAPCIERSGLGKQIKTEGTLKYRPFYPDEIKGYNPDEESGAGGCDGWGMGRGNQKESFSTLEEIYLYTPICRQYRPQQMGFGAIQPRPYHGSVVPGKPFSAGTNFIPQSLAQLHDGSHADPLVLMPIRLPFAFQVYNLRARFQKCAHWDSDVTAVFQIGDYGSDPLNYNIEMDDLSYCVCDDSSSDDYRKVTSEWKDNLPWVLQDVWAPYGGIVCNGAKPECPCYTGKWNYCNDDLMRDGMRITSDQIFELRFWSFPFSSQKEYEKIYSSKPGPTQSGYADETTADIFTFTKWIKSGGDLNDSQMEGYKCHLCVPAPLNNKEFIREIYVKNTVVTYPKIGDYTGTNIKQDGVLFPNLVTALGAPSDFVEPIQIIYPYDSSNPWDIDPCSEIKADDVCVHDTNTVMSVTSEDRYEQSLGKGDFISVVGFCLPDKEIYVINLNFTGRGFSAIGAVEAFGCSPLNIPNDKWRSVNDVIDKSLKNALKYGTDGLTIGVSNESGVFIVKDVNLEINKINSLYIFCRYGDSDFPEYAFKKVDVRSRYWAVTITQKEAVCNRNEDAKVQLNRFPNYFEDKIEISGKVHSTFGTIKDVFSVYSYYQYGIDQDTAYYSYCINEYTKYAIPEKWTQIGNSGYLWVEIDDPDISYLWNFEILEAEGILNGYDESDNGSKCGDIEDGKVKLKVVFPSKEDNGESFGSFRKSVPPNAVILKTEKPIAFFNSDWFISIKYKYEKLEPNATDESNDTAKTIWPDDLKSDFGLNRFVESPYVVEKSDKDFFIKGFGGIKSRGTIKVMAYAIDKDNRIQAAGASKLLIQGYQLNCRTVDINYVYKADATGYDLEPSSGFFTWTGAPTVIQHSGDVASHSRAAKCGDHECGPICIGPMWYPFNACGDIDFYNVLNGAAQCTMPVSECEENFKKMGPGGWRYCGASEYECWVSPGGNFASVCGTSFYYHYSHAPRGSMQISGKARKKGLVDKEMYLYYGWALPTYGNKGREFVERFISREFTSFWDFSGEKPTPRSEFMPMVFDYEDLYSDPNCFSKKDLISPLHEPFVCIPMLSNYLALYIDEMFNSDTRFRFDEIIEVVHHGYCMYPFPYFEGSVSRYSFKNDNIAWVWPDFWVDIKRDDGNRLWFLELLRPSYFFDIYKKEHRLIIEEGSYEIIVKAPTEESDGCASIRIDKGPTRFFNMIYDNYDTDNNVDWNDEIVEESEDGDGSEQNIYEQANNGKGKNGQEGEGTVWFHSYDTLFDNEASPEPNEERKIPFITFNAYYNRGLVAHIPINKLFFFPTTSELLGVATPKGDELKNCILYVEVKEPELSAVTAIKINCVWGLEVKSSEVKTYSIPSIRAFDYIGKVGDEMPEEMFNSLYESTDEIFRFAKKGREGLYKAGSKKMLENYDIDFNLTKNPKRFIEPNEAFYFRLSSVGAEEIKLNSVSVEISTYKSESKEVVSVFEKKYYVSNCDFDGASNADGENTKDFRNYDLDFKNAGQYFPYSSARFEKKEGKVLSKTTMIGFGMFYNIDDDEEIPVSLTNLSVVEDLEQRYLYIKAKKLDNYDDLKFIGFTSPVFFYIQKKLRCELFHPSFLSLKYEIIDWEKDEFKNKLRQEGEVVQPGGHYFKWSDSFIRDRCYIFGPVQNIYSVEFVHHKHGGSEATLDAGHSLRGWGRLDYMEGRLWQMEYTGDTGDAPVDLLSAAVNFQGGTSGLDLTPEITSYYPE